MNDSRTILGFDFGMKYIGVAVGQEVTNTARPLTTISAKDGIPNWQDMDKLIATWSPKELIVGIPLNMDGTTQELTFAARKFANRLKEKYKIPVSHCDERLTTFEAKERLWNSNKNPLKNKELLDATSACIILEQWLNSKS